MLQLLLNILNIEAAVLAVPCNHCNVDRTV